MESWIRGCDPDTDELWQAFLPQILESDGEAERLTENNISRIRLLQLLQDPLLQRVGENVSLSRFLDYINASIKDDDMWDKKGFILAVVNIARDNYRKEGAAGLLKKLRRRKPEASASAADASGATTEDAA